MASVPTEYHDLFEKQTFAHVATLMPDDTPHVTPVWVDYDAELDHVLFNTARGRLKERNLQRDGKIGVSMTDPEDSYRFLSVRGEVVEFREDGAVDHIDELALRYMDVDEYPYKDDDEGERIVVHVRPDHVATD